MVLKICPALEFPSAPELKPCACNLAFLNFIPLNKDYSLLAEYLVPWL